MQLGRHLPFSPCTLCFDMLSGPFRALVELFRLWALLWWQTTVISSRVNSQSYRSHISLVPSLFGWAADVTASFICFHTGCKWRDECRLINSGITQTTVQNGCKAERVSSGTTGTSPTTCVRFRLVPNKLLSVFVVPLLQYFYIYNWNKTMYM